jgi:hypothetical protein
MIQGTYNSNHLVTAHADLHISSATEDKEAVKYHIKGLDKNKKYTLGFTWWDFDGSGIEENVSVTSVDGEGFFDVSSNKKRPFIVKTEKYDVKVLGTKYNLMAYSSKGIFETSLLEGSVVVLKSGSSNGILIKPDERIFLENNRLVKT